MNLKDLSSIDRRRTQESLPVGLFSSTWQSWDRVAIARMAVLTVIIVLSAGVRLWGLNQIGYNTDEAVYSGQAAAIARDPVLKDIFPIFRAHPLLFQFLLALLFQFGVNDLAGRLLAVAIGVATVYLVYKLGSLLYGENTGLLAALILAVMPYHVIVTRQVLLDGPLVFCSTLTLYFLARFAKTEQPPWLYASGIGMGLTFLAKETGIILIAAIYAFLALSPEIRIRIRDLAVSLMMTAVMMATFPISLWLGGASKVGQQYFVWQLFRRPNHTWDFYLTLLPNTIGIVVIILALLGIWLLRSERTWRERLLTWWILVPVVFFQIWPTKGFQYLLPIAPALAVLASRVLMNWSPNYDTVFFRRQSNVVLVKAIVAGILFMNLFIPSLQISQPNTSGTFIAGTGGVPGGREAGEWIKNNIPAGAVLMTIGPSMANILQFYGFRKAYGLSVSPNPLYRNPSYRSIDNPDLQIRNGEIQYLVWDSYSAGRSPFFSEKILLLAARFNGRVMHTETVLITLEDGTTVAKPMIIIYKVYP